MSHPAFEALREQRIASLNLTVQEFRHRKTGARHLHLASTDTNNAFLVAFLTVPENSTGVAHVLEHTSLCGSQRYPVRDPFFMMIRRSLNTFMNAFTASDWTAYPFASQNRKDFDNLLQVYLDAAFFPRLDPMDFAQEGHRLEFATGADPDAELLRKGVVYNEMKGAMSAAPSQVWRSLRAAVYPTTTYHHNSGGDPAEIAKLSHAALKAFHARHYHPSNALFATYGSFPVAEHQERIDSLALARFEREATGLAIPDEQRYGEPIVVEDHYTLDAAEDPHAKTHVVLGWLLGHGAEPRAMMEAHLLSGLLLEHGASPLRQALETTDLGTSPSELCGLDDEPREMMFAAGLEGSEPERAEAVERLVIEVLERVAREGLPHAQVESVLHQIELSQREVGGGHFPYGLQLVLRVLAPALHGGDPIAVLDLDPILIELREAIRDPEFIKGLVRRLLLDNPHRVRLTMTPDTELAAQRTAAEHAELEAIRARLSDAEKQRITTQAAQLKARQEQADDPEQLPRVGLEDIPADRPMPEGETEQRDGLALTWYAPATNGLVYQQVVAELPALSDELVDELPLFSSCLTEVGCGSRDYLATQTWQAAVTGGIDASTSLRTSLTDLQQARGLFALGGKALVRNAGALDELLLETFTDARFDELPRLRELIAESRARSEASVTGHGHVLAMTAACAGMTPCAALAHRWDGLLGLRRLKELDKALAEPEQLAAFAARLEQLRELLAAAPRQLLLVGEAERRAALCESLQPGWGRVAADSTPPFAPAPIQQPISEAWSINTQVNFCARAYPAVAGDHPDAPALTVLGPVLRNGYLHRAIREQGGAYGAGAGYSPDSGAFRFFSYRDPRLAETLADFDHAIEWLLDGRPEARQLEEAILNVISDIDRPSSPAGEAMSTFFGDLHGRTAVQRRRYRGAVLGVGLEELRRVTETYLRPEFASVAVLGSSESLRDHEALGLALEVL